MELNHDAGYFSKLGDTDCWGIDNDSFNHIQQQFGLSDVDRIAGDKNAKLPELNTKFFCPGSSHVN